MPPQEHARIVVESWKISVSPAPIAAAPVRLPIYRLEAQSRCLAVSQSSQSSTAAIVRGLGDGTAYARNLKKWKPRAVLRHIGADFT